MMSREQKKDLVQVKQFCMTCDDNYVFEMDKKGIVEQYAQWVEINFCEVPITLPPENCLICQLAEDDEDDTLF